MTRIECTTRENFAPFGTAARHSIAVGGSQFFAGGFYVKFLDLESTPGSMLMV